MSTPELPESKGSDDDSKLSVNYESGYVTLPFGKDQFHSFVMGLLGRPQTFEKAKIIFFSVQLRDIESLHHLFEQRISQQNNGKLIQVVSKVNFSDDSSFEFGSLDELITHNELRNVATNSLRMTWSYMLQFSDKEHPERQELEVKFDTGFSDIEDIDSGIGRQEFLRRKRIPVPIGRISYRIRSTNRGWILDIGNLIDFYIDKLDQSRKESRFIKQSEPIGFLAGFLLFASVAFWSVKFLDNILYSDVSAQQDLLNSTIESFIGAKEDLGEKIVIATKLLLTTRPVISHSFPQETSFIESLILPSALAILVGIIGGMSLAESFIPGRRSFVLLTYEDENRRLRFERSARKIIRNLSFTVVVGIGVNFISSFILYLANN